jgi:hypothetical protein
MNDWKTVIQYGMLSESKKISLQSIRAREIVQSLAGRHHFCDDLITAVYGFSIFLISQSQQNNEGNKSIIETKQN